MWVSEGSVSNWSRVKRWDEIFQGVAAVEIAADGSGHSLSPNRKREGVPVNLVQERTPGAPVVAVKRVNELGFL